MIMERRPLCLDRGHDHRRFAVGATSGYIYLRSEYPHAFKTMKRAIQIAYEKGYLGSNVAAPARSSISKFD